MSQPGITLSQGAEGSRLEIECPHQSGVLYTVPGEASWVCSKELLHAHALAGFMRELERHDAAMGRLLSGTARGVYRWQGRIRI
jgi:hypothetical protein